MTARKHVPGTDPKYSPPSPGWVPCSRRIPVFWDDFAHYMNLAWAHISVLEKKINGMEKQIMSDQDTLTAVGQALDALTAKETSDDAALTASVTSLAAAIAALQAAAGTPGTPLDFTGVNASLAALQGAADANAAGIASVAALIPAPPAGP